MKIRLIYPVWDRIYYQTKYILPPLGVTVVGGLTPDDVTVELTDENVQTIDFDERPDLVAISTMLLAQAKRAFEIGDRFRAAGVPVVLGGLSTTVLPDEAIKHADAIVVGEAEGVWPQVVRDFQNGTMKQVYRRDGYVSGEEIGRPRRDLLEHDLYNYRGVEMMGLVETSRGCKFACLPCQVPYVSGTHHRQKPIHQVVEEMAQIPQERIFIVDNAMEQNEEHQKQLFQAMIDVGLDKKWVAHPITPKPEILELAARAGCWYVYHSVFKPHQKIRDRIKMHHDYGIGIEGTIMLGLDFHTKDVGKRMVDFLLDCDIDLAEFTTLTPFPGTGFFDQMKKAGRLLHEDWSKYNAEHVVFRPAKMSPDELTEVYRYCWEEFYRELSERDRMYRLFLRLHKKYRWNPQPSPQGESQYPAQGVNGMSLWGGVSKGERAALAGEA